ncbi:MAG: hypothetical protein J6C60_00305 [Alistipes sp.]|nr:hypothetical protein [Alistipes sp.]MBO5399121.1 hypothetical protein [Alistipes sp.]
MAYFVAAAQVEGNVRPSNAPRISGRFEPDSIGIGDRFTYSIEVEKDLVQTVIFPNFAASAGEQFELIEDVPVDTLERDGRRLKLRKSFRLAAFQEGVQRILPQVMYADKNIIDTLYGEDTLSLLVTTFEIDSTSHSIFDIKPQKTLPFRFGEISGYLMWSLVALVVLAIGLYVAYRIMRHYGKSLSDIFHPAPPMPPHEEAFRALERLYVLRLCQHDKHKLYYSTLTDILRRYIAARFEVGAMEMTSDEIIAAMREVELPKKAAMDMADVLRAADLVKFAKAIPESDENEASYQAVWDFVELTKPVEEQPTEEE